MTRSVGAREPHPGIVPGVRGRGNDGRAWSAGCPGARTRDAGGQGGERGRPGP